MLSARQRWVRSGVVLLGLCGAIACRGASPGRGDAPSSPPASSGGRVAAPGPAVFAAESAGAVTFSGMCDASGGVRLGGARIVVANDDDNVLRVYDAARGGAPLAQADLSTWVGGEDRRRESGAARREADLEAGALASGRAFWITSHARGDKGKKDDSQSRFFSTTLAPGDAAEASAEPPAPRGVSYAALREDLRDAPSLRGLGLRRAAKREAEEGGGLNIEGLAAGPDGRTLLLGFRGPLEGGKALVVPLTNADEVSDHGARARFGEPVLLDLGGRGIRELAPWNGRVLVSAGSPGAGGDFALYVWDVASNLVSPVSTRALDGLNPEGLIVFDDLKRVLVLSDDGDVARGGLRCGRIHPYEAREFRGVWLTLTPW